MSMVANKDRPTKWWGRSDAQGKTPTDLMDEDDINLETAVGRKKDA